MGRKIIANEPDAKGVLPEPLSLQKANSYQYSSGNSLGPAVETPSVNTHLFSTLTLLSFLLAGSVSAAVWNIPKKNPVVSFDIPSSWKPEATDKGFSCESPDQIATVFFEVTAAKNLETLIEENLDWLVNDQKVTIVKGSKRTTTREFGEVTWRSISWDGNSKEWGPADIGFMFLDAEQGKVITVTHWISKKGAEKHAETLRKIFSSVKLAKPPAKRVLRATLALDKDTKPATVFTAAAPKIYAFWIGETLMPGDKVKGVWIAEDVGEAAPKETKIDEAILIAATPTDHSAFSLSKPTNGWPPGKYRVEIFVGEKLVETLRFTITKQ